MSEIYIFQNNMIKKGTAISLPTNLPKIYHTDRLFIYQDYH